MKFAKFHKKVLSTRVHMKINVKFKVKIHSKLICKTATLFQSTYERA